MDRVLKLKAAHAFKRDRIVGAPRERVNGFTGWRLVIVDCGLMRVVSPLQGLVFGIMATQGGAALCPGLI